MTKPDFTVHTPQTAPEAARPTLEAAQKTYGFIPNLYGVFAESPATVEGYFGLSKAFGQSGLDPVEQQIVLLSVSHRNACHYCMAAHSVVAKMTGASQEIIEALRNDTPLPSAKHEALRTFARAVVDKRGEVAADIPAFLAAGYTQANVLDVLLGNALKTLSNYTNHVAETPVDAAFAEMSWTPPADR